MRHLQSRETMEGSAACRAMLCSRSFCTEEHSYLTMVCSAMAGPEVKNSRDAVKDARAVPDRCRMCLAHSPVFQTVGSASRQRDGRAANTRRGGREQDRHSLRRL